MNPRSAVVFALFIGCLAAGTTVFAAPAAGATGDIEIENTLAQSPADDRIDVETRLSIPDSTRELVIVLPEGADVYESNGFEQVDDRTYEWTESTTEPTIQYDYEGTVHGTRGDREGVFFVVDTEWALVRTPSIDISGRTTDPDSEIVRKNAVDGEGIASSHMAYLGPYTEHLGSAAGQEFRLVVPDAADLREEPDDILDTFEHAAERLTVGTPTPEVFVIAAPTADYTWAPAGLQRGDGGDMWVRDVERLGGNRDTWIHEYVHTRQRYAHLDDGSDGTTAETRWTIEGMADYYAALLPYEGGDIDYETFTERLEAGTDAEYDDVRLADPGTWEGTDANYDRGTLVLAHLDQRLRAEADTTLDAVVAEINSDREELTQRQFLEAIKTAGGDEIRSDAEEFTETPATPSIPGQSEHVEAFGGPDVRYSIDEFAVSGPYRDGSLDEPRLVTGETLEVSVTATNVGTDPGTFETEFQVDGETVAVDSGQLDADETTTLAFVHGSDAPGAFDVSIEGETRTVTVEEPADIAVGALDVAPSEPTVGETVTLSATVTSTANRPAVGEVVFTVDGETVGTESVQVGVGQRTVETTISFDEPGEHTVSAGDRSATVTVTESTTTAETDTETEPPIPDEQPGFGVIAAVFALLSLGLILREA